MKKKSERIEDLENQTMFLKRKVDIFAGIATEKKELLKGLSKTCLDQGEKIDSLEQEVLELRRSVSLILKDLDLEIGLNKIRLKDLEEATGTPHRYAEEVKESHKKQMLELDCQCNKDSPDKECE